MVSPSKKKKPVKKGRETQTITPLDNTNPAESKKPAKSSRKPLASKKIYLDIRSAAVLSKLEKDLKQLGARIEPFLDTDIDYVVTDRAVTTKAANGGTTLTGSHLQSPSPLPPTPSPFAAGTTTGGPSPSPSPGLLTVGGSASCCSPSPSPGGGGGGIGVVGGGNAAAGRRPPTQQHHHHVTRSRAEAMLDCVRAPPFAAHGHNSNSHNNHITVDPIETARAHNLPVYRLHQFVRWVEKLLERSSRCSSTGGASSSSGATRRVVKVLNKHFVKLESADARRRPEFRELPTWPVLRYEGSAGGTGPGGSPFETRGTRLAAAAAASKQQQQHAGQGGAKRTHSSRRNGGGAGAAAAAADRMTRKEALSGGGGGGYCEMCCLDYGDLTQHLTSAGHLKLAQDPAQFAALDSYIRDACLDTFLANGATHCSVVVSPVTGYNSNNNNNNNNSRRVLRSSHQTRCAQTQSPAAAVADKSNGQLAIDCNQPMGNRGSSSSGAVVATNGHLTRSATANHRATATTKVATTPPESGHLVMNGGGGGVVGSVPVNHNHLTRLSVKTDLAAAATVGVSPPLATPTTPQAAPTAPAAANDEREGVTRRTRTTSSSTGGSSSAAGVGTSPRMAAVGTAAGCKQSTTTSRSAAAAAAGLACGASGIVETGACCGDSTSKHHLRSKKQLRLPHALQGTTAEDGGSSSGGNGGSVQKHATTPLPQPSPSQLSPRVKRRKLRRRKRLSVEEKLIEDNRSYYKVEVLNSKLRSTGYYMSQRELELNRCTTTRGSDHSVANSLAAAASSSVANSQQLEVGGSGGNNKNAADRKEPVVMRFKKVRKSELSLLSDEAENFMFGDSSRHHQHHHQRSSDRDDEDEDEEDDEDDDEFVAEDEEEGVEDDEEGDNTTMTTSSGRSCSTNAAVTAAPLVDESSNSSCAVVRGRGRPPKRKRRTHAELFINDNKDYYKFDLSSSRLRCSGEGQGVKGRHGDGVKVEKGRQSDSEKVEKGRHSDGVKAEVTDVETGSRRAGALVAKIKDEIKEEDDEEEEEENNTEMDDDEDEEEGDFDSKMTADKLSFAFESAPVHEAWYQTYRRQDEAREFHMQAYHTYPVLRLPYEYRDKHKKRLLWAQAGGKAFQFRRRKRRGGLGNVVGGKRASALDDKPRKSPRCHASTLAILSTLKFRRRRISPGNAATMLQTPTTASVENVGVAAAKTEATPSKEETAALDLRPADDVTPVSAPTRTSAKCETDFVTVAESLDNYFCQFYFSSDRYATVMRKLRESWIECCNSGGGNEMSVLVEGVEGKESEEAASSSALVVKTGSKEIASKRLLKPVSHKPSLSCDEPCYDGLCMDVDPSIVDVYADFSAPCEAGPQEMDFLQLLAGYKQCNSMERALYGHIHPRAIDSLRRTATTTATSAADHSCASSECGGSSTGELLGFTEDGRMLSNSRRRKRKKRNMTGWPKDKPKKLQPMKLLPTMATQVMSGVGVTRSLQKVMPEQDQSDEVDTTAVDSNEDVAATKVTRLSVSRAASLDSDVTRVLRGGGGGVATMASSGGVASSSPPKRRASTPPEKQQQRHKRRGTLAPSGRGRGRGRGGGGSRWASLPHWSARRAAR